MEHVCTIRYKFTYYRKPEVIAKICELLKAHINKHCAGIGSLQFKYDYNRDHVESPKNQADGVPTNREANILCIDAELKTQNDDIGNILSTMMEDTPKNCMGQSLKCHYTFTKKVRMGGGMIKVTLAFRYKFDEKPEPYSEPCRDGIFSPSHYPRVNGLFRELQSKKWARDDSPRQP
jgi:hypothetical protein